MTKSETRIRTDARFMITLCHLSLFPSFIRLCHLSSWQMCITRICNSKGQDFLAISSHEVWFLIPKGGLRTRRNHVNFNIETVNINHSASRSKFSTQSAMSENSAYNNQSMKIIHWLQLLVCYSRSHSNSLLCAPAGLTWKNSKFYRQNTLTYFVWISEQTAIIFLYKINWLFFF